MQTTLSHLFVNKFGPNCNSIHCGDPELIPALVMGEEGIE